MDDDFIYWKHPTPVGVKVEEVFGEVNMKPEIWKQMAMQIFCEHGPDNYRDILHFNSGAPLIKGLEARISITHTPGFLAVAFLPRTPEADLSVFNQRTAMGIDAEKLDRKQVLKVRDKFLNETEQTFIIKDNLKDNIIAWTAKEALLKASLNPGIDYKNDIIIKSLPELQTSISPHQKPELGNAELVIRKEGKEERIEMKIYSYESEGYCVTIAFSPKCATFERNNNL